MEQLLIGVLVDEFDMEAGEIGPETTLTGDLAWTRWRTWNC